MLTRRQKNELAHMLGSLVPQEPFWEAIRPLDADEVMEVVEKVIFPEALDGGGTDAGVALEVLLLRRTDLTDQHYVQVAEQYLSWVTRDVSELSTFWRRDELEFGLAPVADSSDVSLSTLGTFTRMIAHYGSSNLMLEFWLNRLLNSAVCPVEVAMRVLLSQGEPEEDKEDQLLLWTDERVTSEVTRTYPELVGLPANLLREVAASQPIPKEWFQDKLEFPAFKNDVPPFVPVEPLIAELVKMR